MTNKEFKRRAVRHGECCIIPVDKLPEGLEDVSIGRRQIIGHSESGHHHVAVCDEADLTLMRPKGADSPDLFLDVSAIARVEHLKPYDRHETKVLQPGFYKIVIKAGYDYFLKRQVRIQD